MPATVAVIAVAERLADAEALAARLGLPLIAPAAPPARFVLRYTAERLELAETGPGAPGPVAIDWIAGAVAHRRRFGGSRGQPIAKAVGLKGGACPTVVDATAGLGHDALVLAALGCRVHLVERSPVIAALLADGLARAAHDAEIGAWIAERVALSHADGRAFLAGLAGDARPEVVYLDPMYPHRDKSARVKKAMRAFRELVGDDLDADALLAAALLAARKRVVVKRPKRAPPLAGPEPSFALESPNTRFDVYAIATP